MSKTAKPVTTTTLLDMKRRGEKITMLTAYDATFAGVVERAGVDSILVGDSLGMVVQGHDSTLPVSVDDVVYHCAAVSRGSRQPLLIADMPFMSDATLDLALTNAQRLMAEGGAQMVKIEGAGEKLEYVARLVACGVPVCGHLGLTPQSVHQFGGYRVQAREQAAAEQLLRDAEALQQAGARLLVLECVPTSVARRVSHALTIPTIGIGAGPDCDGQVLVLHDMLGVVAGHKPRFARDFMAGASSVQEACEAFAAAVRDGSYPSEAESYTG